MSMICDITKLKKICGLGFFLCTKTQMYYTHLYLEKSNIVKIMLNIDLNKQKL